MEKQSFSEDIRRYLGIAWHWAWLLILVTCLFGIAAYIINIQTTPVFQATTRLLVNEAPATRNADYASVLTSERLARTYTELLATNRVLDEVILKLGLEMEASELRDSLRIQSVRDTQLIDVKFEDTDPKRAAAIANAIAEVFREQNKADQVSRFESSRLSLLSQIGEIETQIQNTTELLDEIGTSAADESERERLETTIATYRQIYASLSQSYEQVRLAESTSISNIEQVEEAKPPVAPIRPRTTRNSTLFSLVGLALTGGIVIMVEVLDDTLSPDSVARQLGLSILGVIARHQLENGKPVVATQPRAPVSEAFRSLRTNIQFASVDRPMRTILVTSPSPEDGKSTVAANLGVSLAQSGQKVLIIDADLRRPQVHRKFDLSNSIGLTTLFVQEQVILNGSVQSTIVPNLWTLTSGSLPPNPAELLGSGKMIDILRQAGQQADIVIIDTPPIMAVTDAAALSTRVDGVLLVVKPGTTKLAAAKQAVEQLQRIGANIFGVVLNDINVNRSLYKYNYYKGYYSTYQRYYGRDAEPIAAK